jgi:hypothetical protein
LLLVAPAPPALDLSLAAFTASGIVEKLSYFLPVAKAF